MHAPDGSFHRSRGDGAGGARKEGAGHRRRSRRHPRGGQTFGKEWRKSSISEPPTCAIQLWAQGYAIDAPGETRMVGWDAWRGRHGGWHRSGACRRALAGVQRSDPRLHAPLPPLTPPAPASTPPICSGPRPALAETLARRQKLKRFLASEASRSPAAVPCSHQHGVGADHATYLSAEKGPARAWWLCVNYVEYSIRANSHESRENCFRNRTMWQNHLAMNSGHASRGRGISSSSAVGSPAPASCARQHGWG